MDSEGDPLATFDHTQDDYICHACAKNKEQCGNVTELLGKNQIELINSTIPEKYCFRRAFGLRY